MTKENGPTNEELEVLGRLEELIKDLGSKLGIDTSFLDKGLPDLDSFYGILKQLDIPIPAEILEKMESKGYGPKRTFNGECNLLNAEQNDLFKIPDFLHGRLEHLKRLQKGTGGIVSIGNDPLENLFLDCEIKEKKDNIIVKVRGQFPRVHTADSIEDFEIASSIEKVFQITSSQKALVEELEKTRNSLKGLMDKKNSLFTKIAELLENEFSETVREGANFRMCKNETTSAFQIYMNGRPCEHLKADNDLNDLGLQIENLEKEICNLEALFDGISKKSKEQRTLLNSQLETTKHQIIERNILATGESLLGIAIDKERHFVPCIVISENVEQELAEIPNYIKQEITIGHLTGKNKFSDEYLAKAGVINTINKIKQLLKFE